MFLIQILGTKQTDDFLNQIEAKSELKQPAKSIVQAEVHGSSDILDLSSASNENRPPLQNGQNIALKRLKANSTPKKVEKISISKISSIPRSNALKKAKVEGQKLKVAKIKTFKQSFVGVTGGKWVSVIHRNCK